MLTLPEFSLFDKRGKYPHRHHEEARCVWKNEHGATIEAEVIANWPRTRWWAQARYLADDSPGSYAMRASNALSTGKAETAARWIADCKKGCVEIEDEPRKLKRCPRKR